MNKIISVPEPCMEDWAKMTTAEQGRHCNACCKTVVDFTGWQPQEIMFYLDMNAGQKVCGRFTKEQLNVPIPSAEEFVHQISSYPLSWMKKAAAIFLFAFMIGASSCTENVQGNISNPQTHITETTGIIVSKPDSLVKNNVQTQTLDTIKKKKCVVNVKTPEIMGDIAVQPEPPLLGEPAVITQPPVPDTAVIMGKIAMPQ